MRVCRRGRQDAPERKEGMEEDLRAVKKCKIMTSTDEHDQDMRQAAALPWSNGPTATMREERAWVRFPMRGDFSSNYLTPTVVSVSTGVKNRI